jgi:hypothetical protein
MLNGESISMKNGGVVEPVEVHLGVRYDSKRNKVSGMYEQVPMNDTFIYILFKNLELIFKNEDDNIQSSFLSGMFQEFFVMESSTETIHYIQSMKMPCKFKFISMTLKLQTHWGLNMSFINLDVYISLCHFAATPEFIFDEYPSHYIVSLSRWEEVWH